MEKLKLPLARTFWLAFRSLFFCAVFTAALPLMSFGQLPSDFQKVELITELKNAVNMEFAPDGRIFILDRFGEIIIYKPDNQISVSAGTLDVFHDMEEGLVGIAFDPHFAHNNFVYIHYSHPTLPKNQVSRFKMVGDQLDLSSEIVMIEWQSDRNGYYHAGGDMDFDSQGNLYIAVGDNADHSQYATLNETNQHKSSERTSSNTNDLRGKILRIKPLADGTYSIPEGNLFPNGVGGLPEIYVMGARNPYKLFVDRTNTDWLFWAEVGPDANSSSNLGPEGLDEINLTKEAGNYGWPYFSGKNRPYLNTYTDPNFYYDPEAPVNLSKWNTGAVNLPPAKPSWMDFYRECYLTGPRYYYDGSINNAKKLPPAFDGTLFYYDFNKSKIWVAKIDNSGNILSTEQFAKDIKGLGFIDLKIGPDGQLYILEYGVGCCPSNTGTGKLVRLDYNGIDNNQAPLVKVSADVVSGSLPLTVKFSSEGTLDPDGDELTYEWDFHSDGTVDSNEQHPTFTYTTKGTYNALLRVDDSKGGVISSSITIHAGNNSPTFEFVSPPDGSMFDWRDNVDYHVIVNDVEDGSTADGTIDCNQLSFVAALGHLSHSHDGLSVNECEGTFFLDPASHNTNGFDDIYQVFRVNFTDSDGLTAYDQITIHPKLMEAEFYDLQNNTELVSNTDRLGGGNHSVRALSDGAYIMMDKRNLHNIESVAFRVASTLGGNIEVRVGSPNGMLISSVAVPNTGSINDWMTVEAPITNPGGANDLYFVFKNASATAPLFDVNYIEFLGAGASIDNTPPEIYLINIPSPNSVSIKFNEPLDKVSAEQVSNYAINNGITVSSATLQEDRRTVLLTTSKLEVQVENELTVSNLVNESGVMTNNSLVEKFTFEGKLFRINAGGPAMEVNGVQWEPNQYNSGGTSYSVNAMEIRNTDADPIYLSETYGNFTYEIPVPNPGIYDVSLHFAELYFKNPGDRIFNVNIENGQFAIPNYDIFDHVGFGVADIKKFHGINVEDGFLTITFTSVKNQAKVSGIEVFLGTETDQQPSIKILNPSDGAQVAQPFTLNFQAFNWEVGEGTTHIHKLVDGVNTGEVYDLTAISFDDLTPGQHDIQLVLVNADHSHTEYSAQIKVNVVDDVACVDMEFPLNWTEEIIGSEVSWRSVYIYAEDLDGDGLKDIVTGGWWYKNPGTRDGTWEKKVIGAPMNNMSLLYDFDNDGDIDIFGTQGTYKDVDAKMAWAENDGNGNFTIHTNIPNGTSTHDETFMAGAALGNFNGVDNIQIAVTWNGGESGRSPVQMLTVPADPVNQAWTIESISQDSFGEAISAGDIDGDGDLDLFQAGNWLRNDNGTWTTFSTGLTLPTDFDRSTLADLDNDGSLDGIVTQIGNDQEIAWIKSPMDPTQPWTKETIGTGLYGALSLSVVDMDGDGDLDVITGEWKGEHRLMAFENDLCNTGTFIPHVLHPGGPMDHHDSAIPVDLDNDGALDIISIGWDQRFPRIYWSDANEETAPVVSNPIPEQTAAAGSAFSFTFAGNTFSGNQLTYTALLPDGSYLPQWLTFDGPSRTFSGIPGPSDMGTFEIMVTASDGSLSASNVFNLTVSEAVDIALRINTGGDGHSAFGETFATDNSFSGGTAYTNTNITAIAGTTGDELYRSERYGNFSYNLPVPSGTYTVRLHFAEIWFGATGGASGGIGKRIFNVTGEGQPLLTNFDIYAEVGAMTALTKEFEVEVTDGVLNLAFGGVVENAKISAIEILTVGASGGITPSSTSLQFNQQEAGTTSEPKFVTLTNNQTSAVEINSMQITGLNVNGFAHDFTGPVTLGAGASTTFNVTFTPDSEGGKSAQLEVTHTGTASPLIIELSGEGTAAPVVGPPSPSVALRINTGGDELIVDGETFAADGYFSGGAAYTNTNITAIAGTTGDELYRSERYGNFSYNVPVPSGTYTVRLHFAEIYFGATGGATGRVGRRIFNVTGEGQPLLTDFDIFAEVGAMTALTKEFEVDVTDGALNLTFVGVVENPKISAIEILSMGASGELTASSTSLQFDQEEAGTTSEAQAVTLTNNETSEVEINAIQITGDNGSEFAHDFTGPVTLGAGASTAVNVTFTPDSEGAKSAQLEVTHTGITPPLIIGLSGEGTAAPVVGPPSPSVALRINTGGGELTAYGETFAADGSFSGGKAYTNTNITAIAGTSADELYRSERYGNFSYNVSVPSGTYTVRLHFAEIYYGATGGASGGVGKRVFNVSGEGQPLLTDFDIYAEVGAMSALTKEFEVDVTDGALNLSFVGVVENPKISAIEILSIGGSGELTASSTSLQFDQEEAGTTSKAQAVTLTNNETSEVEINAIQIIGDNGSEFAHDFTGPVILGAGASTTFNITFTPDSEGGKSAQLEVMHTGTTSPLVIELSGEGAAAPVVEPISPSVALRINTGGGELTALGGTFAADGSFSGGKAYTNTNITAIAGTTGDELYRSERYGNFSYNVPVPSGTYTVRLHFAEIWFGATGGASGGVGKRVFNVTGEGQPLLTDFDIYAEVGAMSALTKEFEVDVTDGVLNLTFVGVVENPKISAIEVVDMSGANLKIGGNQSVSNGDTINGEIQSIFPERMTPREIGNVVQVFPNPFDDLINIRFQAEESQEYYITLYDLSGKIVVRESFTSKSTNEINYVFDLSQKSLTIGGVYLVFIESENGGFLEIVKVMKK